MSKLLPQFIGISVALLLSLLDLSSEMLDLLRVLVLYDVKQLSEHLLLRVLQVDSVEIL